MKVSEQYLTFGSLGEILSAIFQVEAYERFFHVVLFVML